MFISCWFSTLMPSSPFLLPALPCILAELGRSRNRLMMLWPLSQPPPACFPTHTRSCTRLLLSKGNQGRLQRVAICKPVVGRCRKEWSGIVRCSPAGNDEDAEVLGKAVKGGGGEEPEGKKGKQKRPPWLLLLVSRLVQGLVFGVKKILKQWWAQTLSFFVVGLLSSRLLLSVFSPTAQVMYSDFVVFLEAGMVNSAQFEHSTDRVYFTLKPEFLKRVGNQVRISINQDAKADAMKGKNVKAKVNRQVKPVVEMKEGTSASDEKLKFKLMARTLPGQSAPLHELLVKQKVRFGVIGSSLQSTMTRLMGTLAVLWIPLLPLFWFFRRSLNAQGNKKTKKVETATPRVLFSDVAGMQQAKLELMEIVSLLKNPDKFSKLNVKVPSGVLLCGPTGTGKTLLARAVAGEAGVPFFAASASEFVEMFVGRGAARIRELFKEARKSTPCVVFIDEIDSVGSRRGYSMNDERDQTLNQLLVELDGFEGGPGFVLLAATNRPDVLDPALLRPGRLTRKIQVSLPDQGARLEILRVHLRDVPMESEEAKMSGCNYISKMTIGFSGAELANCVNEGALLAARKGRDYVELPDLINGVQRTRGRIDSESGSDNIVQGLFDWIGQDKRAPPSEAGA